MTEPTRQLGRSQRRTAVTLGLAAVAMAVAIGDATGNPLGAPLLQPPAPSASEPAEGARSAVTAIGSLPSAHTSARPSPNGKRDVTSMRKPWAREEPALDPPRPALHPPRPALDPPRPALDPPPQPGRFAINLFDEGDFVSQASAEWCVPASILSMMNMIDREGDDPTPTQRELDRLARSLSTPRLRGAGSEPEGWAGSLNRLGVGPYEVRAERARGAAIAAAARAIRLTERPVGLLIWRGAHAWVMTGFRATADPAYTDDFKVTHIHVLDPWYPRVSSIWGPARRPNSIVPVRLVAEDYLAWRRPAVRYPEKDGRFVLVVPVVETPTVRTEHRHERDDRARR